MIYSLNVNEWKFHSPIEWNSCKPLKKEWFCTLNSKFPLIKSENHSKKSELPLIWGVKRRTTRKRIVLRLTPQTSGNSLFLESFSLYMSGNLLFNVQNHSFLSGLQEFHSFGEWNFHLFTFREYYVFRVQKQQQQQTTILNICFYIFLPLFMKYPDFRNFFSSDVCSCIDFLGFFLCGGVRVCVLLILRAFLSFHDFLSNAELHFCKFPTFCGIKLPQIPHCFDA